MPIDRKLLGYAGALTTLVAALNETLPLFVPPDLLPHVVALVSAAGAFLGALMRSPLTPKLPDLDIVD